MYTKETFKESLEILEILKRIGRNTEYTDGRLSMALEYKNLILGLVSHNTVRKMNRIIQVDKKIILKELELTDSPDIFNTIDRQRQYLGKWLPFVEFTKEIKDTEKFVESILKAPIDKFEYVFTIRYNNLFVGLIRFKDTDKINKKTEIGYWLSENFQKRGIITKSVKKLCDFAFNEQKLNKILIKCAVENHPSKEIPKRLDFKFEMIEKNGELLAGKILTDLEVYSKVKIIL